MDKKEKGLVFRGLAALLLWLFIMMMFASNITSNYAGTINNFLGISTTRVVEE